MVAGIRPSLTSEKANFAPLTATAMSQAATMPAPPPMAAPSTMAQVRAGISCRALSIFASPMASSRLSLSDQRTASDIQARSAPALNVPPAPRMNTTRTWSAPCRVSKAS